MPIFSSLDPQQQVQSTRKPGHGKARAAQRDPRSVSARLAGHTRAIQNAVDAYASGSRDGALGPLRAPDAPYVYLLHGLVHDELAALRPARPVRPAASAGSMEVYIAHSSGAWVLPQGLSGRQPASAGIIEV